jgi:hypothetical protein
VDGAVVALEVPPNDAETGHHYGLTGIDRRGCRFLMLPRQRGDDALDQIVRTICSWGTLLISEKQRSGSATARTFRAYKRLIRAIDWSMLCQQPRQISLIFRSICLFSSMIC